MFAPLDDLVAAYGVGDQSRIGDARRRGGSRTCRALASPVDLAFGPSSRCALGHIVVGDPDVVNRLTKSEEADQARSKRSRFMTLSHAATKSRTNFSFESSHA